MSTAKAVALYCIKMLVAFAAMLESFFYSLFESCLLASTDILKYFLKFWYSERLFKKKKVLKGFKYNIDPYTTPFVC